MTAAPDFSTATWRKSSRSNGGGSACVMVSHVTDATGVKDSKLADRSPILPFATGAWSSFMRDVKRGRFDVP